MNLDLYYSVYRYFKTGKVLCYAFRVADLLGVRYLLIRMDTNFICNLRCKTCYFSGPKAKDIRISPMDLDFFKKIAQDVFPKTRVLFLSCGGEPLLTKGFENFIEETGKYKIPYVGFVTNGILMTESVLKSSIENNLSEITFSIDGATKDTYEYIRQGGKFEDLISSLALAHDVLSKAEKHKLSLRFNYTVTRSNYHEMPLLVDLAKKYSISYIKFRIYTDWGGALNFKEESLRGHGEAFNEKLRETKRKCQEANITIDAPREFSGKQGSDIVEQKISNPPCLFPWFSRYIDPKGKVRVCVFQPLSERMLGNNFTMKEFLNSEAEAQRRRLLMGDVEHSCYVNICNGDPNKRPNDDANFLNINRKDNE